MAGINDFILRLQKLSQPDVINAMGRKIADACHAEAIRGFVEQRDPYGKPWAPRKKPSAWSVLRFGKIDNGHRLLDDTGKMIDSLTARYVSGRVIMRIRGYAQFHQTGTRFMVARKIFPEQSRGMGLWREPINQAATDAVRDIVNGRGA